MSLVFPVNLLVDALRAKVYETWPEVNRVPEGLSPEDFLPENLPIAPIVKHPTLIDCGKPAQHDICATTPFDLYYVVALAETPEAAGDFCREKCADLLRAILAEPRLMLPDEAPVGLRVVAVRLDDTPENPAMQMILRHRWPLMACALRVECSWSESGALLE